MKKNRERLCNVLDTTERNNLQIIGFWEGEEGRELI